MEGTDPSEQLIVVRLNCGEPVSVSVSHEELENIPVIFVEASELADDYEEPHFISDDEIVVLKQTTKYEDLEEVQDGLEGADLMD